jgi:hypothetical protein
MQRMRRMHGSTGMGPHAGPAHGLRGFALIYHKQDRSDAA